MVNLIKSAQTRDLTKFAACSNNLRGSPACRGQRLGMLVELRSERALPGYRYYAEDLAQAIEIEAGIARPLGRSRIFGADRDDLFYRERDAPRAQPLDDRR
jgi:hypothetical protein